MTGKRTAGVVIVALCVGAVAACHTADGVIASTPLVHVELAHTADTNVLQLHPAPGARINAQFKPTIHNVDGSRIVFDSPEVTADSEYFAAPPVARLARDLPVDGELHASVCPEGKLVCLSVVVAVRVR
jgi:hypothetical protein